MLTFSWFVYNLFDHLIIHARCPVEPILKHVSAFEDIITFVIMT